MSFIYWPKKSSRKPIQVCKRLNSLTLIIEERASRVNLLLHRVDDRIQGFSSLVAPTTNVRNCADPPWTLGF